MRSITNVYPIEEWLSASEQIAYADYWNDESVEREKPFWILDGDFGKMERYLNRIGLPQQLQASIVAAREKFGRTLRGVGCDLAAGALWAEPYLFRSGAIEKIYCVEYSRHRLLILGPAILTHDQIPPEKIVLALGDFHRLALSDHSLDFVFMSAAFHHSDQPDQLLQEIRRVLKPDGVVILIGEHNAELKLKHYVTQPIKFLVARLMPPSWQCRIWGVVFKTRSLMPHTSAQDAIDDRLGDHEYTLRQYDEMFSRAGFRFVCLPGATLQAFVCVPNN